jgi:hypothetical protein
MAHGGRNPVFADQFGVDARFVPAIGHDDRRPNAKVWLAVSMADRPSAWVDPLERMASSAHRGALTANAEFGNMITAIGLASMAEFLGMLGL